MGLGHLPESRPFPRIAIVVASLRSSSVARMLSKHEAYQLVSIAGHVAITQLVDKPVYGVHVRMSKSTFK